MMTRKHFNRFAADIADARARQLQLAARGSDPAEAAAMCYGLHIAADSFARLAQSDNPNFDRARFMQACGFED